ncbi:hypothetical protein [Marinactinospora rubrisoli]|uniref:Uncharacterized protein n=1 Tax=Marinactinospora rubrisoli TaxID=2715399 RepID=A0ABW2KBV4_9ACTN
MSNTVRHVIGAVVGLVLVPVTVVALGWSQWNLQLAMARFDYAGGFLIGMAGLLVLGIVLGLAVGSRMSPLASLIPGIALAVLGGFGSQPAGYDFFNQVIPFDFWWNGVTIYPLLGVLLLAASLPVSRWRSGRRPSRAGRRQPAAPPVAPAAPAPQPTGPVHNDALPDSWVPPVQTRPERTEWPPPSVHVHHPGQQARPPRAGEPPYPPGPATGGQHGMTGLAGTGPQPPTGRPGGPDHPPPGAEAPEWTGRPAGHRRPEEDVPHLYGTGPMPQMPPAAEPRHRRTTDEPHLYGTGPLPRIPEPPADPQRAPRPPGTDG